MADLRALISRLNVPSRYLRDSIGSCHDNCKFGIKHATETKARNSMLKRRASTQQEGRVSVETTNPEQKGRELVTILKSLSDPGRRILGSKKLISKRQQNLALAKKIVSSKKVVSSSDGVGSSVKHGSAGKPISLLHPKPWSIGKEITTKKENPAVAKKVAVSSENSSLPLKENDDNVKLDSEGKSKPWRVKISSRRITELSTSSRRYGKIKASVSNRSSKGGSSSRRDVNTDTSKEESVSKMGKQIKKVTPKPSARRVWGANAGNRNNLLRKSHLERKNIVVGVESKRAVEEEVSDKILYVIETKPESEASGDSPNGCCSTPSSPSPVPSKKRSFRSRSFGTDRIRTSSHQFKPSSEKRNLRRAQTYIYNRLSSSLSPPSSKQRRSRSAHIGTRRARSSASSLSPSPSSSFSESVFQQISLSSSISRLTRAKAENKSPKVDCRTKPKTVARASAEDNNCVARKLKFRRTKSIDIQAENNSPRRLRFRQGRVLESQYGRTTIRTRSSRRLIFGGGSMGSNSENMKPVLRHHVVEGKNGAQSLFNNVIEETASMLVQTRKSKVKALVGAFETVISLQDNKPSATN